MQKARLLCLLLAMHACLALAAASPLASKTFSYNTITWIVSPGGIVTYDAGSRTVRAIQLDQTGTPYAIRDAAQSDNAIWLSTSGGLFMLAMSTGTVEAVPFSDGHVRPGVVAADADYVWLPFGDTLWSYDKLSKEWLAHPIRTTAGAVDTSYIGAFSDGNKVNCLTASGVSVFTIADEKWKTVRGGASSPSPRAPFFLQKDALLAVSDASVIRYIFANETWDIVKVKKPILDISVADTILYCLTEDGLYSYVTATGVVSPLEIPGINQASAFAVMGDTVFIATPRNVVKYSLSARTTDAIELPRQESGFAAYKVIASATPLLVSTQAMASIDPKTGQWEIFPVAALRAKRKVLAWDDNGLTARYSPNVSTTVTGKAEQNFLLTGKDSVLNINYSATPPDTSKDKVLYMAQQLPMAGLTAHTSFAGGRYADVFFDNTDQSALPQKGIEYHGTPTDRLSTLGAGTEKFALAGGSQTMPAVRFEGASSVVGSKATLSERDRKIVRTEAGAGLVTTRTYFEVLAYRDDGRYLIRGAAADSSMPLAVVPGSISIYVDGELIDSSLYTFAPQIGQIQFSNNDILDPSSVITVSYQMQTVPDNGLTSVEFVPKNNFGDIGYAAATVSPNEWLSARASYLTVDPDTCRADTVRRQIASVALPIELRKDRPDLFLKLDPELSVEASKRAPSAGLTLQSRFGKKTSLLFDELYVDPRYITSDVLSRGYGQIHNNADFTLGYDVTPDVPLKYYEHDGYYQYGKEHHYELSGGLHFPKLPFFDVSVSSNTVKTAMTDTFLVQQITPTSDSLGYDTSKVDSISRIDLSRQKNKLVLSLYETSSPYVEKLLHLQRLSYELTYTGFATTLADSIDNPTVFNWLARKPFSLRGDSSGRGDIFYGRLALSPIQSLTFTTVGTARTNPLGSHYAYEYSLPTIMLQTIDAPLGCDISLDYALHYATLDTTDSSTADIARSANALLKPGKWLPWLKWISPFGGIIQTASCEFPGHTPGAAHVVLVDEDVVKKTLSPSVGANIYPTDDITFRNENTWTTMQGDSTRSFTTFNDLKWWFGSNTLWQTRWQYDKVADGTLYNQDYNRGYSRYDHSWTSWLKTTSGVAASLQVTDSLQKPDSTREQNVRSIGPEISAQLTTQQLSFVKKLLSSNSLGVYWVNGQDRPNVSYSFYLRLIILPNISLISYNALSFKNGSLNTYNGNAEMALAF